MQSEYLEADIPYRKKLFTWYGTGTILFVLGILFVVPEVKEYILSVPGQQQIDRFELFAAALLFGFTIPAGYLVWLGTKVIRDKQYPYKGMRVIRKTEILREKRAHRMGRFMIVAGIFSIVLLISSLFMTHNINEVFMENPLGYQPRFNINR